MDIFIQCCTKKKAFCTCMHINVHRHSHRHRNLIENAAREFSESHCFMNSIYKVLAVSAALLVVSSGCAVVKVMAGCEKKKSVNEITTTPLALLHYQPCYHENSCHGTVHPVMFTQPQEVKHSPSPHKRNAILFMTSIIFHNSVNVMFTFSPMFFFQFFFFNQRKVKEGIN